MYTVNIICIGNTIYYANVRGEKGWFSKAQNKYKYIRGVDSDRRPVRVFGAVSAREKKIITATKYLSSDSQVYPVNMNPVKFFFFLWLITRSRYENNGLSVLI